MGWAIARSLPCPALQTSGMGVVSVCVLPCPGQGKIRSEGLCRWVKLETPSGVGSTCTVPQGTQIWDGGWSSNCPRFLCTPAFLACLALQGADDRWALVVFRVAWSLLLGFCAAQIDPPSKKTLPSHWQVASSRQLPQGVLQPGPRAHLPRA